MWISISNIIFYITCFKGCITSKGDLAMEYFASLLLHTSLKGKVCHRLNCDVYLGDVMGSVLMCIFNVD